MRTNFWGPIGQQFTMTQEREEGLKFYLKLALKWYFPYTWKLESPRNSSMAQIESKTPKKFAWPIIHLP